MVSRSILQRGASYRAGLAPLQLRRVPASHRGDAVGKMKFSPRSCSRRPICVSLRRRSGPFRLPNPASNQTIEMAYASGPGCGTLAVTGAPTLLRVRLTQPRPDDRGFFYAASRLDLY